jgi:hypothetical protein
MKKLFLLTLIVVIVSGCRKSDIILPITKVPTDLAIDNSIGIKLESTFVSGDVSMNVKSNISQPAILKISDLTGRVVSKSEVDLKAGDNILKVYSAALPSSAYRIGFYDIKDNLLSITDFNKL